MPSIETSGEAGVPDVPAIDFLVRRDQRALMQGHALGAEEQFSGAQHERILASIERIAQDDVHQLVEEDVRDLGAGAHDIEIGCFQGRIARQAVAERDHHLPVLARIRVGNRGDVIRP